jgi:hypothetical protein
MELDATDMMIACQLSQPRLTVAQLTDVKADALSGAETAGLLEELT